MDTGMLWYDNDPKTTLRDKIIRAAEFYRRKYGLTPTCCLVNTKQWEKVDLGVLKVRYADNILPFHLWIGVN